ncbi:MAG: redoxin family protein [Bacteroidota bacterium]
MALLCLFGSAVAQNKNSGLVIGDRVPDVVLTGVINHSSDQIRLSEFKGKLLIIDFWATWCSPCIAMFPKTDSLQKKFSDKVVFLPVTYQSKEEVSKLFSKAPRLKNILLPMVTGDKTFHELFPHKELPHYVWIGGDGVVRAITGTDEVNVANIQKMLNTSASSLVEKIDVAKDYNREIPLLLGHNGIDEKGLQYHKVITSFVPGLQCRFDILRYNNGGVRRITATNATLQMLFALAWSNDSRYFNNNRILAEVNDPDRVTTHETNQQIVNAWMQSNTWCYEIIVPQHLSGKVFELMQQDLLDFFPQYTAGVEKRKRMCLVLERTSTADKLKTSGNPTRVDFGYYETTLTNSTITRLVSQLNIYLQHLPTPVVDRTGYTGNIDLRLDADLTQVNTLREALQAYDLDLVERETEIEMLVIRDSK